MKYDLKFVKALKKNTVGLDGIIEALGGEPPVPPPPPPNPKTVVTYHGGTIQEYFIEGELEQESIPDKENAVKIDIGAAVTSIGFSAFGWECSELTSITIPNSIVSIGDYAFADCYNLMSVTIPDSVTSIGGSAFQTCETFESIIIPNKVTSIGDDAFDGCLGLSSITIPSSVTSIGESVFVGCSGLTSIIVDPNNRVYDSRNNCNAIINTSNNELIAGCKNTTIPNSVTSIGNFAFEYCSGLTSITIPDNVTNIGNSAFSYCSSLMSITIPDGVTSINNSTFRSCSSLMSIIIPNSVTNIEDLAFDSCTNLSSITCQAITAPTVKLFTFGNYPFYTGQNSYQSRKNVLKVPQGATGYNTSYWADPLQDSTKCGFHIETI